MAQLILMTRSIDVEFRTLTGWVDVPLTPHGIEQAIEAGKALLKLTSMKFMSSAEPSENDRSYCACTTNRWPTPIIMHNDNLWKMRTWSNQIHGQKK